MLYLLDTNTVIYYLDGTLSPKGFLFVLDALQKQACALSVISKIEVLGFQFPNATDEQKSKYWGSNFQMPPTNKKPNSSS